MTVLGSSSPRCFLWSRERMRSSGVIPLLVKLLMCCRWRLALAPEPPDRCIPRLSRALCFLFLFTCFGPHLLFLFSPTTVLPLAGFLHLLLSPRRLLLCTWLTPSSCPDGRGCPLLRLCSPPRRSPCWRAEGAHLRLAPWRRRVLRRLPQSQTPFCRSLHSWFRSWCAFLQ